MNEQPERMGGRKRQRLFFRLLADGSPAWCDEAPTEGAFVLAGFAVRGLNGCDDTKAWPLEKARARALELAASAERFEATPPVGAAPLRPRLEAFAHRALDHAEDAIEAEDHVECKCGLTVKVPVHGVRQQAAQLGWTMYQHFIGVKGNQPTPEEAEEIEKFRKRLKRIGSKAPSPFAEKLARKGAA